MLDRPIDPQLLNNLEKILDPADDIVDIYTEGQAVVEQDTVDEDETSANRQATMPTQKEIAQALQRSLARTNSWLPRRGFLPRSAGTVRSGFTKNHSVGVPKAKRKLAGRMRKLNRERG